MVNPYYFAPYPGGPIAPDGSQVAPVQLPTIYARNGTITLGPQPYKPPPHSSGQSTLGKAQSAINKAQNTIGNVSKKVGEVLLLTNPATAPFAAAAKLTGAFGGNSWLDQLKKWIAKSEFFTRVVMVIIAIIFFMAAFTLLAKGQVSKQIVRAVA